LFIQDILDFGIAARHRVADDHQIGMRLQVRRIEALVDLNAEVFQKSAHRRIDIAIRAGNGVTALLQHPGQRRHARAANRDHVNPLGHNNPFGLFSIFTMLS
jgi:hypothetical protein